MGEIVGLFCGGKMPLAGKAGNSSLNFKSNYMLEMTFLPFYLSIIYKGIFECENNEWLIHFVYPPACVSTGCF